MDLLALADFNLVARHGGFGKAARATGRPKATLSRRVTELEAALQLRLFERGARTLKLTEEGRALWETADGRIRHQLLPNGRYDEARGRRESAYQGRYEVSGDHIEYWDDTGFTADGDFVDGVLYHAGMVLYRKQ